MKNYIIGVLLFVVALVTLGTAATYVMNPDQPKKPRMEKDDKGLMGNGATPSMNAGGTTSTGNVNFTGTGPAAMTTSPQGTLPRGMSSGPGMPGSSGTSSSGTSNSSSMSGPPGLPGQAGLTPGLPMQTGSTGAPAVPRPPQNRNSEVSVPIIQPDDIGSSTSPTAGRLHQ